MAQKIASLYAEIGADTTKLEKGLASANTSLKGAAKNADELGTKIGRFASGFGKFAVEAGITALGAALLSSVKAASDFEQEFAKIVGLTDTAKGSINDLKASVLSMARDSSIGANELAKGLYFISSSGFKGAEAMEILRMSSKAAAAGLGETKTIADAVTSALNAYQLSGSSAARITDVLTQAVKEGKGEPAEFAGALGRVLPVAAAAGVNIEQVAASMATMTRTGLTAEEAATSLRGVLGALLAPTKQASDALLSIGLTSEDVANKLKGDGLVATLQLLMDRTGGNIEKLDAIIPNIRALTGVLSTAGSQGKAYAEILGKMENAAGTTDKAFAEMSGTLEFKLKKAHNSIEALGITVANKLLPPLGDAAEAVTTLVNWHDKLIEAEVSTEVKVRASAKSWDEYSNTMVGVTRAEEERMLLQRDKERGLLTQTEYEKELASVIGGVTRAAFDEARMFDELAANVGDVSAYSEHVDANAGVEAQAILTTAQLKEQAKATKEEMDALAQATIDNYAFVESFKDFTAVSGAKQTISDLEELIKANPENRDNYAAQIRAISQEFGFTNVAMETGAATFRILEGLWQTGAITTDTYAAALGRIKTAAEDGKVSVDELGLKTGEAAAYMTAAADTANQDQKNIVEDARTNKEKMLDEMGNAMEGQQTKLQGSISDSMLSVSNSLRAADLLAYSTAQNIKKSWDMIPKTVTTTYNVVVNGSAPSAPAPVGGGHAAGADFIVPPGYPNDSYPLGYAQSGEHVIIEPTNNYNMTVNTSQPASVIREFGLMRAMAGAL